MVELGEPMAGGWWRGVSRAIRLSLSVILVRVQLEISSGKK